jgi:UPF0271 protein
MTTVDLNCVDLNCDMGEGCDNDVELLDLVTSANIACGFHAGGASTMAATVQAAKARGVAIGAHPSLDDREGFGRRELGVTPAEAYDITAYQIGALQGIARATGVPLKHVKAHGALYNMAARDEKLAEALARAVKDVDASLLLFALAGSRMMEVGRSMGLRMAAEVFADRSYQDDGALTPRSKPGAMITDVGQSISQVMRIVREGCVVAQSGKMVALQADTVCIHGDQPGAVAFARALREALTGIGVSVKAP